ncbi:hypothetical protein DERP_005319 [Dermatophagoides pteronyssinus]|uniref:Uncharacterized protein n=1 Tax=Dermatophagoides pteronyssinus TaxID=6956 RepID=A0ABQ8JMU8_DERPT|nr:hypothetical protein DERP_005319 [Dermatophagoides pteronyssinus]
MFGELDWQTIVEQFVHIGLIFGAIFQLICIGAAIFLPCKSELESNNQESNNNESSNHRSTKTFQTRTNERFLDESDDQQDHYNNDDQDLNVGKIYGNRHGHVHQRQHHHHHIDDNRSSSSSSRGTSSSWNNKNKEKKKRR